MPKITLPSAKLTLNYPLWACDFDPQDPNLLYVGGGGGPGRNGVRGSVLTLLDTSHESELQTAGEIELDKQEDNVATLAIGPRKDRTTYVFAGVNGSEEDAKKNRRNPHFRVFGVTRSAKSPKSSGVKIAETAREALFAYRDADTYQRILRLSQPLSGSSQLGAVATGLSNEPQIALFDVPASGTAKWKSRARLDVPKEAMDLDVVQTGPETYQLAYCDKFDIFTVDVTRSEISEPKLIYTLPPDDGPTSRPSFRSIRYLSSDFLFAVVNTSDRKGVSLHGYRLPKNGQEHASLAVRKKLPKSVSQSTGLAIRNLSPATSPTEKQGESQYVIAVAGSDCSISLFTLEYAQSVGVDLLYLAPLHTIKSVHPAGITGLSFSTFPSNAENLKPEDLSIKLASVSMANTAVVHSIPLKRHSGSAASTAKEGSPKVARYVVALQSQREWPVGLLITTAIFTLIMAIVGQVALESMGHGTPIFGVNRYLTAHPNVSPQQKVPVVGEMAFSNLLTGITPEQHEQIVIRHDDTGAVDLGGLPVLQAAIHNEEVHGPAKKWDEMETHEQHQWKQRLQKTGHWVEDMGETVLKGVVFGEIGGAIGAMVGEAL